MSAEAIAWTTTEERKSKRIPYRGQIEYVTDNDESGKAAWLNVSRSGSRIRIGRYLKPGRILRIKTSVSEFTGYVVWCNPGTNSSNFEAGVQMINEPVEASLTVLAAVVRRLINKVNTNRN